MPEVADGRSRAVRIALIQGGVLAALCLVAFREQVAAIFVSAVGDKESAHLLAAPIVVALLAYRRRHDFVTALHGPNAWGLVVILLALLVYAATKYPFNYAYPRRIAIVAGLAGVVLTVGGWRVLWRCAPMILVLLVAIPITPRHYARMIIIPETITLEAVRATLDMIPGYFVELEGPDLSYVGSGVSGTIALGEPYRGASLFLSYLTLGMFVAFARYRPWWHLLALGALAGPILLFCNYARLLLWGILTILTRADPLNGFPRVVSITFSLVLAWGLFALVALALAKMVTAAPPQSRLEEGSDAP